MLSIIEGVLDVLYEIWINSSHTMAELGFEELWNQLQADYVVLTGVQY